MSVGVFKVLREGHTSNPIAIFFLTALNEDQYHKKTALKL